MSDRPYGCDDQAGTAIHSSLKPRGFRAFCVRLISCVAQAPLGADQAQNNRLVCRKEQTEDQRQKSAGKRRLSTYAVRCIHPRRQVTKEERELCR